METETRVTQREGQQQHEQEHEDEQEQSPQPLPLYLVRYLYVGYFLARWGARTWEFAVALYMIHLWPNSLLLAAIYGAVESGSTAVFGPIIGQWIEATNYVKVLRLWLVSQNFSFLIAGGAVIALLMLPDLKSRNLLIFIALLALTNVSGAIGVLSTLAGTILIERDWVVVVSEGHTSGVLTKMNSVIRGIDLSSKLMAPVITGFIISFASLTASAMTFAAWATVTVWLEYWLFISVYKGVPALRQSNERRSSRSQAPASTEVSVSQEGHEAFGEDTASRSRIKKILERLSEAPFVGAWKVYLKQETVLPGVALALLFFTVLSFGTLMTATLQWEGIPAYIIGIGRGISATIGLAATLVYPAMQTRLSTLRTGLWAIWGQWSCLVVSIGSIWVKKGHVAAYMLMAGVAASRLGLWMFDLAVVQQMQDLVPEPDRCVVGGVQNSLQSALDLTAYVLGIIVSDPQDFWISTMISFLAVTLAGLLYTVHLYRVRKHIFHFDKILLVDNSLFRSSQNI